VIVVTGASGFIGTALVARLAATGRTVVGIDRRPPAVLDRGTPHVVADLADDDRADVRLLLRDAEVVVHLAARPGVRDRSPGVERARYRDNVVATRRVLHAAGGAVIAASSSSVYGGADGGRPCHEDDPRRPIGGYARSKARAEDLCAHHRAGGGAVCVVRPFTVVGPGQRADMAIDRWLRAALDARPIDVFGALQRSRDVTDVRDVTRALAQLVERACAGDVLPGVLNLGTGRGRTLAELLAAVQRAVPRPVAVRVVDNGEREPDHTLADTTRCAATLGWVPRTDLDGVVDRQLAALTAAPSRLVARGA
jgi:nucleoside-diphosphate-sugar epimerase